MRFYSKAGFTFKEWYARLANVPDLELMVSLAPLGDELTLIKDWDAYTLNLGVTNPAEHFHAFLRSLKEESQWNPDGDDLIHYTEFHPDAEFCPRYIRFQRRGNYELAYSLYHMTKLFFAAFHIDRVCGDSGKYQNIFEWSRNHDVQKVITFFEENRQPSESELTSDSWSQWWPTEKVFANLVMQDTPSDSDASE